MSARRASGRQRDVLPYFHPSPDHDFAAYDDPDAVVTEVYVGRHRCARRKRVVIQERVQLLYPKREYPASPHPQRDREQPQPFWAEHPEFRHPALEQLELCWLMRPPDPDRGTLGRAPAASSGETWRSCARSYPTTRGRSVARRSARAPRRLTATLRSDSQEPTASPLPLRSWRERQEPAGCRSRRASGERRSQSKESSRRRLEEPRDDADRFRRAGQDGRQHGAPHPSRLRQRGGRIRLRRAGGQTGRQERRGGCGLAEGASSSS